jgi:hypothetical protein
VLSPRRYLLIEQRNIPRFDQRKELLRSNVQQALKESNNLHQFEAAMNKKGYQIIKGRGISFTDEKKVTVKGSDLNYSLATIEKILAQQQWLQAQKQSNLRVRQRIEPNISSGRLLQRSEDDIINDVLKPLPNNQEADKHFLHQKRNKKRK